MFFVAYRLISFACVFDVFIICKMSTYIFFFEWMFLWSPSIIRSMWLIRKADYCYSYLVAEPFQKQMQCWLFSKQSGYFTRLRFYTMFRILFVINRWLQRRLLTFQLFNINIKQIRVIANTICKAPNFHQEGITTSEPMFFSYKILIYGIYP